jgi:hypothetical protein
MSVISVLANLRQEDGEFKVSLGLCSETLLQRKKKRVKVE